MHDLRKTSILRCSDSVVEPDAATEHMTINSLDDVVSKLAFECDESAAVLRNAVQTLQGGVQAEVRNLCNRWNVQLTTKNDNGKYSKRADHILKSELENTFIAKAKEHFRAKAIENQPIQLKKETDAPTSSSATERAASVATERHTSVSVATERANVEFSIEGAMAEALHRIKSVDGDIEILARVVDHACHSQQCISHRVATMCGEAKWKISTDLCNDQPLDACGYIAADAVCRLRGAALSEANRWHAHTHCQTMRSCNASAAGTKPRARKEINADSLRTRLHVLFATTLMLTRDANMAE
mgnify:CR=1 FL=1